MISFYKPTPKVTGTAASFYLNKRDVSFFATLIKQDSWDEVKKTGSFKNNQGNPSKKVNIKFNQTEIAAIIDSVDRNVSFEGYHGSNQVVRFTFGPYFLKTKNPQGEWEQSSEQKGFSFRVTRESKEDSSEKTSFALGLTYAESRLLKEYLKFILKEGFALVDHQLEELFKKKQKHSEEVQEEEDKGKKISQEENSEDDLW